MEQMVKKVLEKDLTTLKKVEAETSVAMAVKYLLAKRDWKRLAEVALKASYDFEVKAKGPIQKIVEPAASSVEEGADVTVEELVEAVDAIEEPTEGPKKKRK